MKEEKVTYTKKERDSNLELYRIIVMLAIVAHHYVVNSGLFQMMQSSETTFNNVFLHIFGMWGKTGINCFMLITGYFMCKSTPPTIKKFLKLILEIEFYKIAIYLIFLISGYEIFSLKGCIKSLLPIDSVSTGFTSCFLLFFLCIPFLNILVNNLSELMHRRLVLLSFGIYSLLYSAGFHVSFNYVSWFCVLYFFASYIRIYGFLPNITTKQWGMLSIFFASVSILGVMLLINTSNPFRPVSDSNAIFAVIIATCSFMFFKGLKIKRSKFINAVGGSTFGVLLIHANSDTMREWLWKSTLNNVSFFNSDFLVAHAVISVLSIFVICIIVDRIRIVTIEKYTLGYIDKLASKYNLK